jgi:hypothetical protein
MRILDPTFVFVILITHASIFSPPAAETQLQTIHGNLPQSDAPAVTTANAAPTALLHLSPTPTREGITATNKHSHA